MNGVTGGQHSDVSAVRTASLLARFDLSTWDAAAVLAAVGLVVAFAPPLFLESWTPRMSLVLIAGPVGVVALVGLALRGDVAARLLGAALIWTLLSALTSSAPRSAMLGFVGRDLSALTVVLSAGFWALGRRVTDRGKSALVEVLVFSSACCALVGCLQVLVQVERGPLALLSGRPSGFLTNPVYFGAVSAAGLGLALANWGAGSWRRMLVPSLILGTAVSLSGSRVAFGAAVVVVIAHSLLHRNRASLAAAGVAILSLIDGVLIDRLIGSGVNAASRLSATTTSGSGRFAVWRYGIEAWADRPLVGHGFGRFRPAVQERFSVEFVRDYASDDVTQAWFDAHNVLVGLLVAVGIVGFVLYLGWVAYWASRVGGLLLWALAPIALHWLLQPVSLFTLPLAMLLFGASRVQVDDEPPARPRSISAVVTRASVLVGALLGIGLLVADLWLARAVDRLDGAQAANVASALLDDAVVSDVVAQVYAADPADVDADLDLRWRLAAAESEPDRPYWWTLLAQRQLAAGDLDAAEASIDTALRLQPYNVRTSLTAASLARQSGDAGEFDTHMDLLCQFGFEETCDPHKRVAVEDNGVVADR